MLRPGHAPAVNLLSHSTLSYPAGGTTQTVAQGLLDGSQITQLAGHVTGIWTQDFLLDLTGCRMLGTESRRITWRLLTPRNALPDGPHTIRYLLPKMLDTNQRGS